MPDERIQYSEAIRDAEAASLEGSDVFAIAQEDAGSETGYVSRATKLLAIANKVVKGINYSSDLQTTNKTVIGAINEVNTKASQFDNMTATASGSIATFSNGGDDIPVSEFECDIVATGGGGTPVSPIAVNGFSQADLTNAEKYIRVIDTNPQTYTQNGIDITTYANGKITINGTSTANVTITINVNPFTVFTDNSRTLNINNDFISATTNILFCNGSTTIDTWSFTSLNRTYTNFTALSGKYIDNIKISVPSGQTINNGSLMNEFIVMDTVTTYTVAFGQTIYGGRLIYANGQWSIEATHGEYVFDGTETPIAYGSGYRYVVLTGKKGKSYGQYDIPDAISNQYVAISRNDIQGGSTGFSLTGDTILLSTDTPTGIQICYELETPVIIPITSSTRVKTISGDNNIYSNTGDCEVKYFTNKADSLAELIKAFVL